MKKKERRAGKLSERWPTLACRERNPALVFPTAELPKNCPGETCHMRGGPFAHDDTGAKGNGDVDWRCRLDIHLGELAEILLSVTGWNRVDTWACYGPTESMPLEGNESWRSGGMHTIWAYKTKR